ncbi:unnamed protein product, partial [Polarella glacialis]
NAWQQEGYFKVLRGPNSLKLLDFGAWGGDWKPKKDKSRPSIFDVEVAFAPVPVSRGAAQRLKDQKFYSTRIRTSSHHARCEVITDAAPS